MKNSFECNSPKKILFSSETQEGLLQIMIEENRKLKEKIGEIIKENEDLKFKNEELNKLVLDLTQSPLSNHKMLDEILQKNYGDQQSLSMGELDKKEFSWSFLKKKINLDIDDLQITLKKESCPKGEGGKVGLKDKEIKRIRAEIQNQSLFDFHDLKIKSDLSDGKTF